MNLKPIQIDRIVEEKKKNRLGIEWIKSQISEKGWNEVFEKFQKAVKDSDSWVKIPRKKFCDIDKLALAIKREGYVIRAVHKSFIFSLYVLLKACRYKKDQMHFSIEETKSLLGFSKDTNSIDYLIKENGLLDKFMVTETKTKGFKGNMLTQAKSMKFKVLTWEWRDKGYDFEKGDYLKLNIPILLFILLNKKHSHKMIFMYCYFLSKCIQKSNIVLLTTILEDKIVREAGFSKNTVEKYIKILEGYGLLEVVHGKYREDQYGDIYKPDGSVEKEINRYKVITHLVPKCK